MGLTVQRWNFKHWLLWVLFPHLALNSKFWSHEMIICGIIPIWAWELIFTTAWTSEDGINCNSIRFQWSWTIFSPKINYENIWLTFITTTWICKDLCHLILTVIMFIVNYLVHYPLWYTILTCTTTHTFYYTKGITGYMHYITNFLCLTALRY